MENKYHEVLIKISELFADYSYCKKRKVGCVISIDNGRMLIPGYNGTISGLENNCEDEVIDCFKCKTPHVIEKDNLLINDYIVHTELYKVAYRHMCSCGAENGYTADYLVDNKYLKTNEFTVHAEQNALAYTSKKGISTEGASMFITTSPCKTCAKLIAQSGIKEVIFLEEYKDTDGIEFLKQLGIEVYHYKKGE